jgi:hypothetical protein
MVSAPRKLPFGVNVAVLVLPEFTTAKLVAFAATELICQLKVKASLLKSEPVATNVLVPLTLITTPVAAGDCEAQVGATFLFTTQVCVVVLRPLLTVATRLLLPLTNEDDAMVCVLLVPVNAEPLSVQVATQLGSLVVTVNVLFVEPAAAIL